MDREFGTVDDYTKALRAVIAKSDKHLKLLRTHCEALDYNSTAAKLATAVGYPSYRTVNTHYGTLARQVA